jgi:hypothetical protein
MATKQVTAGITSILIAKRCYLYHQHIHTRNNWGFDPQKCIAMLGSQQPSNRNVVGAKIACKAAQASNKLGVVQRDCAGHIAVLVHCNSKDQMCIG